MLVSYSYAQTSGFIVAPDTGCYLDIESAEAQFSADAEMNDGINFQILGYIDVFAPQLLDTNGGPYPSGTRIPIKSQKYKTMANLIDEAMGSFPVVPAIGGSRGTAQAVYGFPFRYGTVRRLLSSAGLQVRACLENDVPFGGERATATFYCVVGEESA